MFNHEAHERHEGLLYPEVLFFVSFVRFVVNKSAAAKMIRV